MVKEKAILSSEISNGEAGELLKKITAGEMVTAEDRLKVISQIFAFSPRDWSTDPELWLIYRVALNDGSPSDC